MRQPRRLDGPRGASTIVRMKVALLHDWLTGFRGGERVLEALCEIFPDAPVYTLIHQPGSTSPTIESRAIHTSYLNSLPGISRHYRKFLPLFPHAAESLRLPSDTDLIVSSSHCVIKGVPKPPRAVHISYVHSPMRYLYDQFDVYFGPDAPLSQRLGMKLFRRHLTEWDLRSNANVDLMIANSAFVRDRIRREYGIEARVLHPFVELADFQTASRPKEDFHLMVTAFAPNKRTDLAIEAFRGSGRKLKIIGSGQQEGWLRSLAGPEVEFLGNLPRADVIKTLGQAKSLIFPGIEDFGITPLEALAAGTPVVAFHAGGVLETLNSQVAVFFHEPTVASLRDAVATAESRVFPDSVLRARAADFAREKFIGDFRRLVDDQLKVH